MANQWTITIGAITATIPIAGSNAKINAAILRVLSRKGIVTEGLTPTQIGEAFLTERKNDALEISKTVQRAELRAVDEATIESVIAADNAL